MSAVMSRTVTESDIVLFMASGDTNPVHLDPGFAEQTMFRAHRPWCPGGRPDSAVFGTKLPGAGCIYVDQNLKFRRPS